MNTHPITPDIEQIKAVMEAWSISGLTQPEFCLQNNLPMMRFQYWRKAYKRYLIATRNGEPFVPVQIRKRVSIQPAAACTSNITLTIHCPDGKQVVFDQLPDAGWLKAFLN